MSSGKYALLAAHVQNFDKKLVEILQKGVSSVLDLIQSLRRLMVEPSHMVPPIVHKSSVIGKYFGYRLCRCSCYLPWEVHTYNH
jgi:hypothetical protein